MKAITTLFETGASRGIQVVGQPTLGQRAYALQNLNGKWFPTRHCAELPMSYETANRWVNAELPECSEATRQRVMAALMQSPGQHRSAEAMILNAYSAD